MRLEGEPMSILQRQTPIVLLAALTMIAGCVTAPSGKTGDPYLWLEEIEGEKALSWVREQNGHSLSHLEKDNRFSDYMKTAQKILTSDDRIPYGRIRNGYVYNFWQDNKNVRGLWRRARLSEYRKKNPAWEVLLDLDKLAEVEKENWVYKRVSCLPPENDRCLLFLSRGGKDATVIREFNLKTKDFVKDGFFIPEGKTWLSWYDKNTLLIGTDFGADSLTQSGYPMEQRIWKRGTPLTEAKLLYKGQKTDVGVWAYRSFRPEGQTVLLSRSISFYESQNFYVKPNMELVEIPVPKDAEIQGLFDGEMIVQTKSPWKIRDEKGAHLDVKSGSLVSFSAAKFLRSGKIEEIKEIFVPSKRASLLGSSTSENALFYSVLDNVKGKVFRAKFRGNRWRIQPVKIPDNGSASVVSADDFSKDVLISFQS
ncbi:MAG: S9 family peptidase, partial [Bdellovibrionales bacterium]|nr:S9 family peptidase [Bdellovibrionales bacterium]